MYVECIDNGGYEVSLTVGKVYEVLPDSTEKGLIRIVDDTGEDYLYASQLFQHEWRAIAYEELDEFFELLPNAVDSVDY